MLPNNSDDDDVGKAHSSLYNFIPSFVYLMKWSFFLFFILRLFNSFSLHAAFCSHTHRLNVIFFLIKTKWLKRNLNDLKSPHARKKRNKNVYRCQKHFENMKMSCYQLKPTNSRTWWHAIKWKENLVVTVGYLKGHLVDGRGAFFHGKNTEQ